MSLPVPKVDSREATAAPSLGVDTVLIADGHAMFRFGIAQFLLKRLGVRQVLEAETFEEALERLRSDHVDLAIFDLHMPGIDDPGDLKLARDLDSDLKIVILSACDDMAAILSALAAGVNGYIFKSDPTEAILEKLTYILSGEIYVPPAIVHASAKRPVTPGGGFRMASLTERQKQIAQLLPCGKSNKEIAAELGMSPATVKTHLSTIYDILGVKNRAQAAVLIQQR